MVKTVPLFSLTKKKNEIINRIENKILSGKLKSYFDIRSLDAIKITIEAITLKLKIIERIKSIYFSNIDFDALNGIPFSQPFEQELKLGHDSYFEEIKIKVDNHLLYKEIIDSNFQQFIMTSSSCFENIVKLINLLLKKSIVYSEHNKPQSETIKLFLEYWEQLVLFEYRLKDDFTNCIDSDKHDILSVKYMGAITGLRNSYLHGSVTYLNSDNGKYKINSPKVSSLPDNEKYIDDFTEVVFVKMRCFIEELFNVFLKKLKNGNTKLPL